MLCPSGLTQTVKIIISKHSGPPKDLLRAAAVVAHHAYTHLADSHTGQFQAGIASGYRHPVDQAAVEAVHSYLVDRTTDAVVAGCKAAMVAVAIGARVR